MNRGSTLRTILGTILNYKGVPGVHCSGRLHKANIDSSSHEEMAARVYPQVHCMQQPSSSMRNLSFGGLAAKPRHIGLKLFTRTDGEEF